MESMSAGLTGTQADAVETSHARVVCIAGAGAGKTRVLTRRIARLLLEQEVGGSQVLAVTFTRKAAAEMRSRLAAILLDRGIADFWRYMPEVRTLHAWGVRVLREHAELWGRTQDFAIYDEDDEETLLRWCAFETGHPKPWTSRPATLRKEPRIMAALERRIIDGNAVTFDQIETCLLDMIRNHPAVKAEWTSHYLHVLVDEYQDTNLVQVAILAELFPPSLFVVGDPRQSIYGWRGADPSTIVQHAQHDPDWRCIELAENWRSHAEVVDVANALVDGPWKPMISGRGPGGFVRAVAVDDQAMDAALVVLQMVHRRAADQVFVLGRTWRSLEAVAERLQALGVPCWCPSLEAPDEGQRTLRRLLGVLLHPADDNLVLLLAQALGEDNSQLLAHLAEARKQRIPLLERLSSFGVTRSLWAQLRVRSMMLSISALLVMKELQLLAASQDLPPQVVVALERAAGAMRAVEDEQAHLEVEPALDVLLYSGPQAMPEGKVKLLTVHAAKGLEAEAVVVLDFHAQAYPGKEPDESLRVAYVAVTRAAEELVLMVPRGVVDRFTYQWSSVDPSPFLERANLAVSEVKPLRGTW